MLLKKENKCLFQIFNQNQKPKRISSSLNKRSLIKIPSTSKLPKDFFKSSNDFDVNISKETLNSQFKSKQIKSNKSLLFTFSPNQCERFCQSVPQNQFSSLKLMKKNSQNQNFKVCRVIKKSITLKKNQSQKIL